MNQDLLLEVIGQADATALQNAIGNAFQISVFPHANLGDYTVRLHALETRTVPSNLEIAQSLNHIGVSVIAARHGIAWAA
jgi:hypothetical protein